MMVWRFSALGCAIEVRSEIQPLHIKLDALLCGYDGTRESVASIRWHYVFREGASGLQLLREGQVCYESEGSEEVLDFFQIDLYRRIVQSVRGRWLLHAAALCQGTDALVLAGPSNAGKSTICRALMAEGWTYLSEEITSMGADDVDALRRPLHLEAPTQAANLSVVVHPTLMRDDPPGWIVSPPAWPDELRMDQLRVRALVRVQYSPGQATKLARLDTGGALEQFWDCRMNTGIDVAQLACCVISRTPCYRLDMADVDSAVSALSALRRA